MLDINKLIFSENIKFVFGQDFFDVVKAEIHNVYETKNIEYLIESFNNNSLHAINELLFKIFGKRLINRLTITSFNNFKSNTFHLRVAFLIEKFKNELKNKKLYYSCLFKIYFLNESNGYLKVEEISYMGESLFNSNLSSLQKMQSNNNNLYLLNISMLGREEIYIFLSKAYKGLKLFEIIIKHLLINLEINVTSFKEKKDLINLANELLHTTKIYKKIETFEFAPVSDENYCKIYNFFIFIYEKYEQEKYEKIYKYILKKIPKSWIFEKDKILEEEHTFPNYISSTLDTPKLPKYGTFLYWNDSKKNSWKTEIINQIITFFELISNFLEMNQKIAWKVLMNDYNWNYFFLFDKINNNKDMIFEIASKLFKLNLEYDKYSEHIFKKRKEEIFNLIYKKYDENIKGAIDEIIDNLWIQKKLKPKIGFTKKIDELKKCSFINDEHENNLKKIVHFRNKFSHLTKNKLQQKYISYDIKKLQKEYMKVKQMADYISNFCSKFINKK